MSDDEESVLARVDELESSAAATHSMFLARFKGIDRLLSDYNERMFKAEQAAQRAMKSQLEGKAEEELHHLSRLHNKLREEFDAKVGCASASLEERVNNLENRANCIVDELCDIMERIKHAKRRVREVRSILDCLVYDLRYVMWLAERVDILVARVKSSIGKGR